MTHSRRSPMYSNKQLGFSDSNIGLLQAIYSFPNIFMVLVGGYIIDRIGTRKATCIFFASLFSWIRGSPCCRATSA